MRSPLELLGTIYSAAVRSPPGPLGTDCSEAMALCPSLGPFCVIRTRTDQEHLSFLGGPAEEAAPASVQSQAASRIRGPGWRILR